MSDFDKISPTALIVAYARQFSGIPYTREISQLTGAEATVIQMIGQGEQQPLIVAAMIEARYRAIDQVSQRFKHSQILELASGLLPRGLVTSEDAEITFIESDLPEMIAQKQQLVQQLVGERDNLHFLSMNALQNLNSQALEPYFQRTKPVTILCEGLLMYLSLAEKQQVLANVREILQNYGGVWITPDFTTKDGAGRMRSRDATLQQASQKIASSTGRDLGDNEFEDLQHAQQFAEENGFQVEIFSMVDVSEQLQCVSMLGLNPEAVAAMLTTTPVVALRLA